MPFVNSKGELVEHPPLLVQCWRAVRHSFNIVYLLFVSLLWPLQPVHPPTETDNGRGKRSQASVHGMRSVSSPD
ncbi:hypothetical protein BASA50_000777 [Batrachochytrium salamandrivorans]|uniref:Uncharacterized protein n=1 Tax=Batrachochytrium salamandrivorans TaxID=1357716 RepID=A0ABQ8EVF4_9FUNG|nr:hypothetical protein BASA62_000168 [Batrachochytrium salamandrivorans]KAH6560178.1 hypothetical protein BASA60_000377 [Batrachochytrium salamandrivorans]KAH6586072.1 hypothetical protein BASA50_000777 [Batrachochytrium salamandrivorans]KAH6599739.1 hypothetical protein BASA61_002507 [Batrachochytrium salamandrivorans]KAH9250832.1 hypothetical protein BASA81_011342 [Batrachochytrium salamandrivorans]